jgi:folate-binding protein YgfZ
VTLLVERRPDLGTILVEGKDRLTWLEGIVTQSVGTLAPGQGAYALAVQKNGKILAELFVVATDAALLVGTSRAAVPALMDHFDKHVVMERVELEDASDRFGWLLVHGSPLPSGVASADFTGRGGGFVCAPTDSLAANEATLAGAVASEEDVAQRWVEAGAARWGVDYDGSNYPQEAGVETRAVSFQKGCYLGQETVFMLQERGHVKKRLVGLRVAGEEPVEKGAPVTADDGSEVGSVTSSAPRAVAGERPVIAWVKYKWLEAGELRVGGRSARRATG